MCYAKNYARTKAVCSHFFLDCKGCVICDTLGKVNGYLIGLVLGLVQSCATEEILGKVEDCLLGKVE